MNRGTIASARNVLLAAVVAVSFGCGDSDQPSSAPPLTTAALLQRGPEGVGVTTSEFEDTSRSTMANGNVPGLPSRTLPTEIWYPTDPSQPGATDDEARDAPLRRGGTRHPLIIYSHGFMDTRGGGTALAQHLASYGYIVASADFPLTNLNTPGGPNARDLVNQPGDVHFLIDRLLALSADSHSFFAGAIDPDRIGLTGLSLGGSTTFLATFHPTLRDPRVRAAAPIAGMACFFGSKFYGDRHVPLLIVHGSIDAIVPYQQNAVFGFSQANTPKYLATLADASHTGFTSAGVLLFENLRNPDDVGCKALGGGTHGDDGGPSFTDLLGGADAGIIMGDCPPGCADPTPRPRAMRPSRQLALERLAILPFFDAYLRNDQRARAFLEHTLAAENADITLQAQP
ncbi:MAG: hypothetical protein HYR72_07630 [Deltaproteobacteria bacterium]|nr:hypothetical protein [Deltaproteobacteria bacterium]MBI3386959.1 hypothetical protein [Deltaproteobacteria bacterium]